MLNWLFYLDYPWLVSCQTPPLFFLWQHCWVDSWDSASFGDTLWLAPLYVLFPLVADPVGSSCPKWVCPFLFPEWFSWLRLAPCRTSAGWTVPGCKIQAIFNNAGYHTMIQQEQMALFGVFLQPWLSGLLVGRHSCRSWFRGIWDCSCALWLLRWKRQLAMPALLYSCWGWITGIATWFELFRTLSLGTMWQSVHLLLDSGDGCVGVTWR